MKNLPKIKSHLYQLERFGNPEQRKGYLRLDKNENIAPFPRVFVQNIRNKISAEFISMYPEFTPLRNSLAKWVGCKSKNIYITAGSDAAIKSVFEAFINPGDKVALIHPTYAMYYVYTKIFQGNLLKIDYQNNLSLNSNEILNCIKENKPKLLCIANPNSPTGTIIPKRELEQIIRTASHYQTVVLVDEAYYLYYPITTVDLINKYPNLIVTRSFSKAFGLASLRLGAAVANEAMIANILKVRPMYESNAFAALIGEALLDNYYLVKSNVRKSLKGKIYLENELRKIHIKYHKTFTNFVIIEVGSYQKSKRIKEEMRKSKILIGGGYKDLCLNSCIRVTVGPKEYMRKFFSKLKKLL